MGLIVKAALTLLTLAEWVSKGGEIMPASLAIGTCLGAAVFSAASSLLPASILGAVGASRSSRSPRRQGRLFRRLH